MALIPSGINYVGNKWRMLSTVLSNIDYDRKIFMDMFCGSGVVGANCVGKFDNVYLSDGCWQLISILHAIITDDKFIEKVENVIHTYKLGKDSKEQFIICRDDFNKNFSSLETFNPYMCYALACHSFSYNMVFNKNGGFSVPSGAGRSWFNPTLKNKLVNFQRVLTSAPVALMSYKFDRLASAIENVFPAEDLHNLMIYLDPPYSACCADGSVSRSYGLRWGWEQDQIMMAMLDKMNSMGVHWLLSNVFENKGVENTKLKEWARKYNVIEVPGIEYANAHYQARPSKTVEVLIRNY
jgi:DNA adenine methylase Dam